MSGNLSGAVQRGQWRVYTSTRARVYGNSGCYDRHRLPANGSLYLACCMVDVAGPVVSSNSLVLLVDTAGRIVYDFVARRTREDQARTYPPCWFNSYPPSLVTRTLPFLVVTRALLFLQLVPSPFQ